MNQSNEFWKPVVGYEGYYEVSNLGQVRTVARVSIRSNGRPITIKSKIRSLADMPKGHKKVTLYTAENKLRTHTVHSLVLEAFVGPRPEGLLCRHLNGVPSDNRVENLAWGTGSENQYDSVKHGSHSLSSKAECRYGHKLEGPNITWNSRGHRSCRACNREYSSASYYKRPFTPSEADQRYDDILSGRTRL